MAFGMIVISLVSGEQISFMVAPANGSGFRGARDEEIRRAQASVMNRMGLSSV